MNGFTVRLLSFLSLFLSFGIVKAQTWIPFDQQEGSKIISTEVIKSDQTGYEVRVTMHGLSTEQVTIGSGEFVRLSIGRMAYISKVGEPSLPLFSQSIAIPSGARVSAKITDEQWTDVEMGRIFPAQRPLLETERSEGFDYDEEKYKYSYIPTLLNIGQTMQWRDIRNTTVSVCPFKYYPQENRLSVMKGFVLQVNFTYDERTNTRSFAEADDPYRLFDNIPFTDVCQTQERSISESVNRHDDNYYNYLIIVGDDLGIYNSLKLKEFCRWKALKGYKTKAVPYSTINNLKDTIAIEYQKGVRYVLFIGDSDKIELGNVYTPRNRFVASDYWYGCLEGDNDLQADVAIGRFSVCSWSDFCNMVDKTIKYEKKYNSSNEALLVAHLEGAESPVPWTYQGCCEQISGTHNDEMTFIKAYGACIPQHGNNATNASVISAINNGSHIVNYRGHGSPILWGKKYSGDSIYIWNCSRESFTTNEINNMNNETCSVFFSVACHTGNIEADSCMLEKFMRSDHGAVAFIGATTDTDPSVNNGYDILLFDKLLNEYVYHLGDLNVSAHISNSLTLDEYYKDNPFCYICGGDPTLEIWTAEPQTMSVDWSFGNGYATITTNLSGNYYIAIASMDGERLDSIACSSSTCTFPIPANHAQFYIAVNKHDYFPHIIYYDSVSGEIVDETFDYDAYYKASPVDIISSSSETIVKSGHKLGIKKGSNGVTIWDNFKCEKGARFEIK